LGKEEKNMKASAIGIVLVAVLMILAGAGLGIAQAKANCSEKPVAAIGDQEMLRVAYLSDYHVAGPIGAGELPEGSDAISSHELQKPVATAVETGVDEGDTGNSSYMEGPVGAGSLPEGAKEYSSGELQTVEANGETFYISEGYQYGPD